MLKLILRRQLRRLDVVVISRRPALLNDYVVVVVANRARLSMGSSLIGCFKNYSKIIGENNYDCLEEGSLTSWSGPRDLRGETGIERDGRGRDLYDRRCRHAVRRCRRVLSNDRLVFSTFYQTTTIKLEIFYMI